MSEYISREELIEGFKKSELSIDNIRMCTYPREEVMRIVYDTPSADVRPNIHGHWEDRDGISDFMYCSNCGGKKHYSEKWIGCPYCLADMREPKGEKGTE